MHHRSKLVVAHRVCTAVGEHIEIYVLCSKSECIETGFFHCVKTALYRYEMKFLNYTYLVQLKGHVSALVEFNHSHSLFVL